MNPYAQKAVFKDGLILSTMPRRNGAEKHPRLHPINTTALTVVSLLEGKCSGRLPNTMDVQQVTQKPIREAPAEARTKLLAIMITAKPEIPTNIENGSRILPSFLDIKPKAIPAIKPANVEIPIMVAPSAAVPIPASIT